MPFHGGFGLLTIHGIAKPGYRAYELLHGLGTELIPLEGEHPTIDAWLVRGVGRATVLLTNFMPTTAVNTISKLTFGLVNSKKSCQQRSAPNATGAVLGLIIRQNDFTRA